jgi:hypothetical protein
MPGKALSILALSLMLDVLFAGTCCQAAKSYSVDSTKPPYKQHLHNRHKSQSPLLRQAKESKTQTQTQTKNNLSLADRYRHLSYREILDQSPVLEGAYAPERKELSDELTTLKANGYDVNQATRQFFALEDLVRTRQYAQLTAAFAKTRQSIAEAVAQAQGISVASSRTINWQR